MPNESFPTEETVRQVMSLFLCDETTARDIIKASEMNGNIGGIMNMANSHSKSKLQSS